MTADSTSLKDLHGEYKVPGGKLVIADLSVRDELIESARINGDFFLEPDEALDDINAALRGVKTDTSHADLRAALDASLRDDAVLFGFDTAAIATAVRRATGHATRWEDHSWQIIPPTPLPIMTQLALDQILTEDVAAGRRAPAMRLWQWTHPAVVIGSFQSYVNEINPEGVTQHNVTVARRISGGGAMFMEQDNCVTYSLYAPLSLVDGMSFSDSYPFLDAWVMQALADMGVEAYYKPLNDIATPQGKIGGAAQKRLARGGLLHHITMSYDIDADKMTEVLRIGQEKLSDKGIRSAKKRVDPLRRQTGLSRQQIWDVMINEFRTRYGAEVVELGDDLLQRAEQLAEEKFNRPEWTHRVP